MAPAEAAAMAEPADDPSNEVVALATARVRDARVRKAHVVDGGSDIVSVCREMRDLGLTHVLVRDPGAGEERLGMFTTTDLRDALLIGRPPERVAVREVSQFALVDVDVGADLFEALWRMLRHRTHRIVVRDGSAIVGTLSQLDLVSLFANHSHLIALQIDDARDIDALARSAAQLDRMVESLQAGGIHVERIARLAGELGLRLFARAWELVAPTEVVDNSCLIVMGSEGRGEQTLKTDQDNALIVRDGFDDPRVEASAARFGAALGRFGYPPCPGRIMVTNPLWRQSLAGFERQVDRWFRRASPEDSMHLAVFFDATPVAGDGSLLQRLRDRLDVVAASSQSHLAQFAAEADRFHGGGNWFTRLTGWHDDDPVDLKKLGLFPIVHGVRALSLRHGVRERGTADRIAALLALGHLRAGEAGRLRDALHFLMTLRLQHQLAAGRAGRAPDNIVRPSWLSPLERETLADVLAIVRDFRTFLREEFHFETL